MSWIHDLLPSSRPSLEDVQPEREERFPRHTYGPGYPIVVHQQEIDDLRRLLEIEGDAPDGWENDPLLSSEDFDEIIEDVTGFETPPPEARRDEIEEIIDSWQEQLTDSQDAVWTAIGTDYRFKIYIARCEARADVEGDRFEIPPELETAREILERIETAQNTDSKLAIVHKRDLPLEEPEEEPTGAS
ncbi:hypothetical protein [Halorubrum sp. Boch-26]|uniref:hypothetical protein n=1 Tax=Halorubrum sp. Boch-26 TaxID=2994426 RepID=UPI0024686B94|nr:hypothetical protein [Halorubrum sp. Boch-26]